MHDHLRGALSNSTGQVIKEEQHLLWWTTSDINFCNSVNAVSLVSMSIVVRQ